MVMMVVVHLGPCRGMQGRKFKKIKTTQKDVPILMGFD